MLNLSETPTLITNLLGGGDSLGYYAPQLYSGNLQAWLDSNRATSIGATPVNNNLVLVGFCLDRKTIEIACKLRDDDYRLEVRELLVTYSEPYLYIDYVVQRTVDVLYSAFIYYYLRGFEFVVNPNRIYYNNSSMNPKIKNQVYDKLVERVRAEVDSSKDAERILKKLHLGEQGDR